MTQDLVEFKCVAAGPYLFIFELYKAGYTLQCQSTSKTTKEIISEY